MDWGEGEELKWFRGGWCWWWYGLLLLFGGLDRDGEDGGCRELGRGRGWALCARGGLELAELLLEVVDVFLLVHGHVVPEARLALPELHALGLAGLQAAAADRHVEAEPGQVERRPLARVEVGREAERPRGWFGVVGGLGSPAAGGARSGHAVGGARGHVGGCVYVLSVAAW